MHFRRRAAALLLTAAVLGGVVLAPLSAAAEPSPVDVWWPVPDVVLSGALPLKALHNGMAVGDYRMYWQVDGGGWVEMYDSWQDHPHKEAWVDVGGWSWNGEGPYVFNFIAVRHDGTPLGERAVSVRVAQPADTTAVPQPVSAPLTTVTATTTEEQTVTTSTTETTTADTTPAAGTATTSPTTTTETAATTTTADMTLAAESGSIGTEELVPCCKAAATSAAEHSNPFSGMSLAVDAGSVARQWADGLAVIAVQPQAAWLGEWSGDIRAAVSRAVASTTPGAMPVFVAYNIPHRDCGGYSAGGIVADKYRAWIRGMKDGLGSAKAAVILEPDALGHLDCLSSEARAERLALLQDAVQVLSSQGSAVYIDAGHARWLAADEMGRRLAAAGVAGAAGFSLNVSNFIATDETVRYGEEISRHTGIGAHFVIDTSRNGRGPAPDGQWCNPWGRGLGKAPGTNTGHALVDAYLWIKRPGESDGWCNGGPSAGTFFPEYALELVRNRDE